MRRHINPRTAQRERTLLSRAMPVGKLRGMLKANMAHAFAHEDGLRSLCSDEVEGGRLYPAPVLQAQTPVTAEEWLHSLPGGYRERALLNVEMFPQVPGKPVSWMVGALSWAFYFTHTPEGAEFWYRVVLYYKGDLDELPPIPELPHICGAGVELDDIFVDTLNGDAE